MCVCARTGRCGVCTRRHHQVLSLFKSEDVSDHANSVHRGRRLGSSHVLHLTVPVLPLRQPVSQMFLARDMLEFLSRRNFLDVFLLTHQRRCNGRLLGVEPVTDLFINFSLCPRLLPEGF